MSKQLDHKSVLAAVSRAARDRRMRVYLVGGAVRDRLLGRATPPDLDFLVVDGSALDLARTVAERLSAPEPVLFPRFHTAQVYALPWKLEFVDARSESYARGSRKPQVKPATLAQDIERRDFTINAILLDLESGEVLDPLGGRNDLRRKILRTPLDPDETFRDDPLRMLRAVRFAAKFDFAIEPSVGEAIRRQAGTLCESVSVERIKIELDTMILLPQPALAITLLDEYHLLGEILPELEEAKRIPQDKATATDLFQHSLQVLERITDFVPQAERPAERYAALLHDLGKIPSMRLEHGVLSFHQHELEGEIIAGRILGRLRASREEIEEVSFLVRWHMLAPQYSPDWSDAAIKRLIRRLGPRLKGVLRLAWADIYGLESLEHNFWHMVERIERCDQEAVRCITAPLDGNQIMALLGLPPGPEVGRIKTELEEAVLEGWLENSREVAERYLQQRYGQPPGTQPLTP